ncbi:MAG: phosphotransferase [Burkholderiaceae bacterium]|nr:phosphotransferase [Burkholderiaceae bacterium]
MTPADDAQSAFSGTKPVSPQHAFDQDRLIQWLRPRMDGLDGEVRIAQFKGGQSNPTFLLRAGQGDGERRFVLRRKPPGQLLPSAHAVDREFRVISALAGTAVPVATPRVLCQDPEVIGSDFYVMDHVEGRIFWDAALPGMAPAERAAIYDETNRVMAELHRLDPAAIGLADYGRPGHYMARQIERWTRQYRAAETEPIAAADALIHWLPQHIPPEGESRIVHGDYRLDNVIFHPHEPRILAVLDWELSTLGDPLVDFAYHCLAWHMKPLTGSGLIGADLAALGIPDEAGYRQRYLERCGRREPVAEQDWIVYLVFNLFRLVGILQGIAKRAEQGNASNARAVETGRRARPLAEQAWALAQTLG